MDFVICIPSYGRSTIINNQTLKMLRDNNIQNDLIKVFVVEEEKELYKSVVENDIEIIVGEKGIVKQRAFIENYFPEGTSIVSLDDDIKSVDLSLVPELIDLLGFFIKAFAECKERNSYIWSVYPVFNKFFRKDREPLSTCLNFCVGAFYGFINRPNCPDLKIKACIDGDGIKEDIEKTILYFKKDGIVLRYNTIGFKTTYYGNVGGLGNFKERLETSNQNVKKLAIEYPTYGKIRIRKNGMSEFVLNKLNPISFNSFCNETIEQLPKLNPELFEKLYELLSNIKIKMQTSDNRRGFPTHRCMCFGLVRNRKQGSKIMESVDSIKYSEIFQEIKKIGDLICPIEYTSIHLNNNTICPKHRDERNVGKSFLVSFGKYTGCKLVIENTIYETDCTPILFNGALFEHWNTPDLVGNKYSLIFYTL